MKIRWLVPVLVLLAWELSCPAQTFVSLDGAPQLSAVSAPPALTPGACAPLPPPCPLGLPPFPPGTSPPSLGGEAIDQLSGTAYVTDGITSIDAVAFPGCAPISSFPLNAWPSGPCGGLGVPPIVAMADAQMPGTLWVLDATGVVSLIPYPPGPILAQALAPPQTLAGSPTGVTFDRVTQMLYFVGAFSGVVEGAPAPAAGSFSCLSLPPGPVFPVPPCLQVPHIGLTLNTAVAAGPVPAITVTDGTAFGDIITGMCPCPVIPPAAIPTTDIDFANVPSIYGTACGCGPPAIGFTGGLPVLGNLGFTVTATGVSPAAFVPAGALLLSFAPGNFPLGSGCSLLLGPPLTTLAPSVPITFTGSPPCTGTASVGIPLPNALALSVGAPIYLQWIFLSPATPISLELSDGLEMVIGLP